MNKKLHHAKIILKIQLCYNNRVLWYFWVIFYSKAFKEHYCERSLIYTLKVSYKIWCWFYWRQTKSVTSEERQAKKMINFKILHKRKYTILHFGFKDCPWCGRLFLKLIDFVELLLEVLVEIRMIRKATLFLCSSSRFLRLMV